MARPRNRERAALERLADRRAQAEERLSDLRRAVGRELGVWAPRRAVWALPMVAFACGLALALAARRGHDRDR
jgi:hypothetical protein